MTSWYDRVSGEHYSITPNLFFHEPRFLCFFPWVAFGFLGGKEVKAAGVANIGLHDRELLFNNGFAAWDEPIVYIERQAFRWVQKYISAFGGDPSKVTMYVLNARSSLSLSHLSTFSNLTTPIQMGPILRSDLRLPPHDRERRRQRRSIPRGVHAIRISSSIWRNRERTVEL